LIAARIEGNNRFRIYGRVAEDATPLKDVVKERSGLTYKEDSFDNELQYIAESKITESLGTNRVILIGDAAHTYYPWGGYGQNVSVEDAFCLGWRLKLACDNMEIARTFIMPYLDERLKDHHIISMDSRYKRFKALQGQYEEKEVLIYDITTAEGLSRFHLMNHILKELKGVTIHEDVIDHAYNEIGFKFIHSKGLGVEDIFKNRFSKKMTIPSYFFEIETKEPLLIAMRPDLMGQILINGPIEDVDKEVDHVIQTFVTKLMAVNV